MHIKGECAIFYLNGGGAIFFNSAVFGDPLLEPGRSFLIRVTDLLFWVPFSVKWAHSLTVPTPVQA
jgi:hypothetical protein